jgi:hypothetical protein
MGRKQIDKWFTIEGRFDITLRVMAKDKAEAIAWATEKFNGSLFQISTAEMLPPAGPQLIMMATKKIKKPRRDKHTSWV